MIKKLIQHGDSAAIIIEKPIMEQLDLDMDTPLEISTDGEKLIISPVRDKDRLEKLQKSLTKINASHGKTLEKLAH